MRIQKDKAYRIAVIILSVIVVIESFLLVTLSKRPLIKEPKKTPVPVSIARIAIVLDDWGYNLNNIHIVDQIKLPFTASILPNLAFSRKVAEELHTRGFEIILHLPMQPHEKYKLEKNTILTSLGEASINKIIDADLSSIVYAKGVSNHMGSMATENTKTMEAVFKKLKNRKLYFLDSLVTTNSVCSELARKTGLAFAKRDIFLDNRDDPVYIKQQINKLKLRAKARGKAIGIGHDRKATLEVLKEVMPQLEKEGFRLVYLSELVN